MADSIFALKGITHRSSKTTKKPVVGLAPWIFFGFL
jgi:hypothetical protein